MSEVVKKAVKLEQWAEDKACAFLVNAPGGAWQENVFFLAQTFETIHADAYRAGRIAQAEEDANWHDSQASLLTSTATSEAGYIALMRTLHVKSAAAIRTTAERLRAEGDLK